MRKKIIITAIVILILVIGGLVGYFLLGSKSKDSTTKKVVKNNVATEFNTELEKQYDTPLKQYYGIDYLGLYDYDNLARFPIAYKDTMICTTASVIKVLEENGDNYKILVNMVQAYSENPEQHMVIEGKYGKARYLKDDLLRIYGVYKGNETYNIDGTTEVIPKINTVKVVIASPTGSFNEFDEDDIRAAADEFFGTTYTLTKPSYDGTTEVGAYLMSLPFHYIITLDNNSNARFNNYRMYTTAGYIDVASEQDSADIKRFIDKSADGKNFILSTYTKSNDFLELQAYDQDFKSIWTRQFKNAGDYLYDLNNGKITLNIDNELYLIDEKTGKDIIDPVMVPKGNYIKLLNNGDTILVTKSAKDFILYITSKGKISFKTSLSTYSGESTNEIDSIYSVLVANDKIYVGYTIDDGHTTHVAVFDKKGAELVNTYTSPN